MATLLSNYIFSPLSGLWSALDQFTRVAGYSRAAAELARLGYHEESKRCMMRLQELRK